MATSTPPRGLEELYKTFLREEDQSKYFIPMQFHVLGRVVQSRLARWSMAAAWLLAALLVAVALAIGHTVAVIESYKTFFFPNKPRGKFAGKPILYRDMLARRKWLIPVYVAIWVLIIAGFVLALSGRHRGRL